MSRTPKLIFASVLFAYSALMGTLPTQARHDQIKSEDKIDAGTPLSAADEKHLLEDNFVLTTKVAAIPLPVQKKMLGTGVRDGMADFGQPYEPSDMVGPKPLPFRRLIFAGTSPGYCVVYNEYGGYGMGQEVSLYHLLPGQVVSVWHASLRSESGYLTLAQLQEAVSKSKHLKNAK